MHIPLSTLLWIMETYKYAVLFPLAVVEGPIVTLAAGLLASLGYFQSTTAYVLILIADTVGDILHYILGYFIRHRRVENILRSLSLHGEKLIRIENHFIKHPKKTIIIGKFIPGIGGLTQVAAGVARMPIRNFILCAIIGTIPKTLMLFLAGYIFGQYLERIDNYFSFASILFLVIFLFIVASYITISKIIEKKSLS